MPKYTFVCEAHGAFVIKISLESFTGTAACPVCHKQTNQRKYERPGVQWKLGYRKPNVAPPGKEEYLVDRD